MGTTTTGRRCRVLGGAALVLAAVSGCGQGTQEVHGAPAAGTPTSASSSTSSAGASSGGTSTSSGTSVSAPEDPSASAPTLPVPSGPVQITAPAEGEHLPAGVIGVTGTGTAPEGTLLWRITDAGGTTVSDGFTTAGANGQVGDFAVQQTVQPGTCAPCTVRVWVPDDSDGEGSGGAAAATRTFWVD